MRLLRISIKTYNRAVVALARTHIVPNTLFNIFNVAVKIHILIARRVLCRNNAYKSVVRLP